TVSGKTADTAEISVKVPAKTDADQDAVNAEAAKIKSVAEPVKNAINLTLPTVGEGYTITIKSSNNESVIAKDGKITPPSTDTTVKLIFTVKHTVSGKTADTAEISVKVPAKTAKQN
ncbi:immunoglobulin-like domain-containing protein, partial [Aneurinibacillus aneurinilyticus]|uniref:immunoglobulin-like domain-containing protein n=1 Tax=Aneurinibacillus aneurinilyticus TaxID=1391 RepID=UPI0023F582AD